MCEGKDRRRALDDFDAWVDGPADGWDAAEQRMQAAIRDADG
jgi:hypothetical protein